MAFFRLAMPSSTRAPILFGVGLADVGRQRIGVLDLLVDVRLVVVGAHFGVAAIGERPINDADGIVRLGILRLQGDVLLVVGLGFFEFLGIKGLARHLVKDGGETVDGAEVVGILFEHIFVFRDGFLAVAHVFVRGSAGNVLAGVGGGEIQARVDEIGIEFFGLLEVFDGRVELGVLERGHTFVEKIAGTELVAAGNAERRE